MGVIRCSDIEWKQVGIYVRIKNLYMQSDMLSADHKLLSIIIGMARQSHLKTT